METVTQFTQEELDKFAAVIEAKISLRSLCSSNVPPVGTTVIYGYEYDSSTYRMGKVEKVDKKGIVTVSNIRFSTKSSFVCSTQKIEAGEADNWGDRKKWFTIFDFDRAYERAIKIKQQEDDWARRVAYANLEK
jgi:hypothetical protein